MKSKTVSVIAVVVLGGIIAVGGASVFGQAPRASEGLGLAWQARRPAPGECPVCGTRHDAPMRRQIGVQVVECPKDANASAAPGAPKVVCVEKVLEPQRAEVVRCDRCNSAFWVDAVAEAK